MRTFIYGKWHAWDAVAGVLLSDEETKTLKQFKDWDSVVNHLYLTGHRVVGRALNGYLQTLKDKNASASA